MEWIKCSDRLPEMNRWVLCYGQNHFNLTGGFIVQSWMAHTNKDLDWFSVMFTHWMPLPEPPNQ